MQPSKPEAILDRQKEWDLLADVWGRKRPDLMFVLGLRRVGKSFVLSRFARDVGGIYYQATKRTEYDQLEGLSRLLGERFDDPAIRAGIVLPSWEAVFDYVTRQAGDRPFFFVLDEFPYLVDAAPALPSIIQRFWDHDWQQTRIKLVLSGSYVSAMSMLERGDQPLYGRRTAKAIFSPFSYLESALFTPGYSTRDKFIAYGTFGQLPGHLALQDPEKSFDANISGIILNPAGRLADDAQHLLDAYLGDSAVYYSIVEAIATGHHTWSGITSRVGRSGGSLSRPLQWLEEMGLVERAAPISEKDPGKSKRAQYRVADPYVLFWHRLVAPLVNRGMLGMVEPERLWKEWIEPKMNDFMGPIFERICRDFVRRTRQLPFAPFRVGEWWDSSASNQVDIVALGATGDMLIGECKWGRVEGRDLDILRRRASLVASELESHPLRVYPVLFSAAGEMDAAVKAAVESGEVLFFSGEELFEP